MDPSSAIVRPRVELAIAAARSAGRGALMPFVTAGFPSMAATESALVAIDEAGADAIEIGIPFSDPIADGPIIAESMHAAIAGGATPAGVFDVVARVRSRVRAALLAMVSFSIVQRMGVDRFVDDAAACGLDGLIVPDLDLDDAGSLAASCAAKGLSFTLLVSPTSPPARIARIVATCSGFVYVLARVGITGERGELPADLVDRIALVRSLTPLPLAVGFGVSTAEHVRTIVGIADAAIVGSALVRRMGETQGDPAAAAAEFVRELKRGTAPRRASADAGRGRES